ncbi:MAG TPA: MiaB/RimO family radical SAM methylthiotransferase [Gemmatimonadaceae bacterium]|nr:MiaB/RimO family radical SAM methylthiotransferase [Gemmatimonadaceae bacterium]
MKVFLKTYGCRANHYDTEAVRGMLAQAGVEEVDDAAEADFAVFNSCSVTSAAESDLRAGVRHTARINPSIRTIVMGCASGIAQRDESRAPLATLPSVESLVVGGDVGAVGTALGVSLTAVRAPAVQTGARALLRIQDGCDEHCTFCITTTSRGENRSRSADDIIDEAKRLSETHPEIVVTGIHIGGYGNDTGSSLGELLARLVNETESVRYRLTSIEATEVNDRLAELLTSDSGRVAPHLHAPLQSGSDRILKRMGRYWYTAGSYSEAVRRLIGERDVFALSGDVICGFPGETDDDHQATVDLVRSLPFTALHVFPYSPRPGTAALRLSGSVPPNVASRRASELRALASRKSSAYAARQGGRQADVVAISRGAGLTEDYLSVAISDHRIVRRQRFSATLALDGDRLIAIPDSTATE